LADASFNHQVSTRLDTITAMLDLTDDPALVAILRARKAGLEEEAFAEYAASLPVEDRPDAETWDVIRRATLARDGYRCRLCGAPNATLQVHHLLEVSRGGRTEPSNLLTLCEDCHAMVHPWLAERVA
jgi:predicted restriction endonuclease